MNKAVLGIGSNKGNREINISAALHALRLLPNTTVIAGSGLYETKLSEVPNHQPDSLNKCVVVLTELSPHAFFGACLGIEGAMGCRREIRQDAKIINIDLLIYEGVTSSDAELTLPHPEILKRASVLVPLNQLFADGIALGLDFSDALRRVDTSKIQLF